MTLFIDKEVKAYNCVKNNKRYDIVNQKYYVHI